MARPRPGLELLLPLLAGLVVLMSSAHAPVVDEEVYLWLAGAFAEDPARPYGFARAMQPWAGGEETFLFAHPPLHWVWVALWSSLAGERLWLLRALAALPPAMLLGWAVARLARRTRAGGVAGALWLASPVTLLALASGLMIDLGATALATAGVAAWREAVGASSDARRRPWLLAAGALLGLGVATKYPMLLPALAVGLHALRLKRLRDSGPLWAVMFAVWGAVELWIGLAHGGFHLGVVLLNAGEIARGPLAGRLLGVLVRTGLAMAPLLLVVAGRRSLTVAAVLGAALLAWALPPELSTLQVTVLAVLGLLGGLHLAQAGRALLPIDKDPHQDGFLLGCWVLAVMLGVGLGHNFASGRYLLPAMAPLACILGRQLRRQRLAQAMAPALLGVWAVIALAMLVADLRYAKALDGLAQRVTQDREPAWFTGEWAFRWRLERAGWRAVTPDSELPSGAIVVGPDHAAPGPLPWERLVELERLDSDDAFPLRLTDSIGRVGWYGETIGALPLGWRRAPLESVTVYRVE